MNYKITREIGSGGIGTVYEAIDLNTKNRVALKLIKNDDLNDDTFLTTFLKEAELGQKLRHKNLTEIYHAGNEENTKYLVMEFLEGQTLRHHIKQKTVTVDNAFPLIKQIAEGLHYMHEKGVVHRDLKATNIIIIKDNIVKIFDFGLSSASMLVSLSDRTQRVGTLVYMSPEQSIGKAVDFRSDIYSLGVILYQIVYGSYPFSAENEMELIFAIHNDVPFYDDKFTSYNNIIKKCLARNPEDRYQDAHEVISDFDQFSN